MCAMIGIAGDFTRAAVGDFARNLAKGIPYRRTPSIFTNGSFNLVAGMFDSQMASTLEMDLPRLAYLAVANPQRKLEGSLEVEWGPIIYINAMIKEEMKKNEEERRRMEDAISGKSTAGNAAGRYYRCIAAYWMPTRNRRR